MIEIKTKGKVVEKSSNPYIFEGKSGTTHLVRLLIDDEIFPFKFKENELLTFNSVPDKGATVNVTLALTSKKENPRIDIVAVETKT